MAEAPDLFGGAFAGRRVLVTGDTGFKGSWLAEWLLALDADVIGYALEPPTEPSIFEELGLAGRIMHVHGDVRDATALGDLMAEARPEIVFHLAAQPLVREGYEAPAYTYETNVMGTVNLLEAVRDVPEARVVVNVTSDKCYENLETGHAYTERDRLGGNDPYSSSKACSELVTTAYRESFFGADSAVSLASVRAGNVIGGGDWAKDRLVPDCVRALEGGGAIEVRNPGAVRPWQHVLEPLSGYLLLAARSLGAAHVFDGAWNFGPLRTEPVTVGQIADAVVAEWGSGEWVEAQGRRGSPREAGVLAIDPTKAVERLGWSPTWSVREAVVRAVAWYRGLAQGTDARSLTRADIRAYVEAVRGRGGYPR